ncbi:hypothetical protein M378DRAFT_948842 [Amanita muscaria Koide BX008]|uniref:Uncharacterized protein n=1 Tax=Amanita muscaria (strain Koide BX008) TaxID=946122 RepID=A0A0C2WFQ0_AMAMK|nr:hypothetical protein M378DRAFT_948842 [Amanita muscaria Koide BX008]
MDGTYLFVYSSSYCLLSAEPFVHASVYLDTVRDYFSSFSQIGKWTHARSCVRVITRAACGALFS